MEPLAYFGGMAGGVHTTGEELAQGAAEELAQRALFWDVRHLAARGWALAAHGRGARGARAGRPSKAQLRRALSDVVESLADPSPLLTESAEAFVASGPGASPGAPFPSDGILRACAALNRRSEDLRRAFWGLVIAGRPVDDVAHELGWGVVRTARAARVLLLEFFEVLRTPAAVLTVLEQPDRAPEEEQTHDLSL